jgi:hypothetical protein
VGRGEEEETRERMKKREKKEVLNASSFKGSDRQATANVPSFLLFLQTFKITDKGSKFV